MYAVWTLCLANLRRKKLQNGLITLLIMLSTLLLATSVTVILNTENVFTDIHNETKGSHQILQLGGELHDRHRVKEWWDKQEGVTTSALMPYRTLAGITHQGKEIPELFLMMMDTPEQPFTVDKLIFAQGIESLQPESGTIWIPTSAANTHDISIGDTIGFNTGDSEFELRVSGIVVDIPEGGPFSTGARIWMNSQDYMEQLDNMPGKDMYMMGLRYDDYSQSSMYWQKFEEDLGTPFLESKIEFEEISAFYLILNKVIGFVMIFLGVVMMLVALYTIGYTISDAILSNYRTMGVIKSLGLTSKKMIGIYVAQYGLLSTISIIPGLIVSIFVSRIIIESSLSYMKTENNPIDIQWMPIVTSIGLLILILVLLCAWGYAGKARFIQPVQAIRYGMSEMDSSKMTRRLNSMGTNRMGFERYPVTFVIGLRNIMNNMKGSILMMVLATITSAVLVFGFLLLSSISSIGQTSPKWGYDSSHILAMVYNDSAFDRVTFDKEMLSDPRVKNISWMGDVVGVFPSDEKQDRNDRISESLSITMAVANGSFDDMGYMTIRGTNPNNKNEIAIGVNVAKTLGKDIGDVVEVYIERHKQTLTITGIYQAIANMSYSARITVDVVKSYNPEYNGMETSFINVHDGTQANLMVDEINDQYKDSLKALNQQTLLDATFKEATTVFSIPFSIMGLLFIMVTFIIILSTCRINIKKESKTYGIYKSIGMTSSHIRLSVTLGIIILSAIGALLGGLAGVYLLPKLLESIVSDYGIVDFPLVIQWWGVIGFTFLSILAAGLGSWVSSRVVNTTSARILVVE
ncbi:ABC transporter permease [Paenibacillus sp. FA6]|uniref:ABC transporter permease n=1 Tax=Paenibacillus sp. FA6 TaxID=3413029 RepID=UPI003F65D553